MSTGRLLFDIAAAWAAAWLLARFGGMRSHADLVAGCTTVGVLILMEILRVPFVPQLLPVSACLVAASWVLGYRLDAEDGEGGS